MTTRLADGKVHATVKRIEVTVALPADVAGPFLEELHEKLRPSRRTSASSSGTAAASSSSSPSARSQNVLSWADLIALQAFQRTT
jgi:hypothetical protein